VETPAAVAAKVAEVVPLLIVTEAGTLTALVLERLIETPPVEDADDRATVQVDDPPGAIAAGEHWRDSSVGTTTGALEATGVLISLTIWAEESTRL
jgi:hypothetical protein